MAYSSKLASKIAKEAKRLIVKELKKNRCWTGMYIGMLSCAGRKYGTMIQKLEDDGVTTRWEPRKGHVRTMKVAWSWLFTKEQIFKCYPR